jgi:hypothetical protein
MFTKEEFDNADDLWEKNVRYAVQVFTVGGVESRFMGGFNDVYRLMKRWGRPRLLRGKFNARFEGNNNILSIDLRHVVSISASEIIDAPGEKTGAEVNPGGSSNAPNNNNSK